MRWKWRDQLRRGNTALAWSLGEKDGKQQNVIPDTRAAHLGIGDVNEKKF